MNTKAQRYSLLLIGIFFISFGLRSAHFLEHSPHDTALHLCDSPDAGHKHNDQEDCSICDFTLSLIIKVEPVWFEAFYPDWSNSKAESFYSSYLLSITSRLFSLRAPPLV